MSGYRAQDGEAPLQFTFINDSESGRMNLVGVSKPNPPGDPNSGWTQISPGHPQSGDYCTQKLKACKVGQRVVLKNSSSVGVGVSEPNHPPPIPTPAQPRSVLVTHRAGATVLRNSRLAR